MTRRILLAVLILGAVVAWARCQIVFPAQAPTPTPVNSNSFFAGCFEGPVTDPAGAGTVTLVLETPETSDQFTLSGCLEAELMLGKLQASVAGSVQDDRQVVKLLGAPVGGGPPFFLQVDRHPEGNVFATSIDLTNEGGTPFIQAAGLLRCARTCAGLGIPVPFAGGQP